MHIRIINPDYGVTPAAMADRCRMLQRVAGPDVHLSMVCLTQTHVEINSPADVVAAGPEILSLARQAEADGCDAVVLYCFSDPALEACRDSLSIPVVGGAQASLLLVPQVARQAAVLLADKSRIPEKKLWLPTLGLAPERIWGVAAVDMGGVDIWQHRDEALAKLTEAGRRLVADGAPCIVLGCLSFLGLARPLEEALGVPVVDPAEAAVAMAEALARLRRK